MLEIGSIERNYAFFRSVNSSHFKRTKEQKWLLETLQGPQFGQNDDYHEKEEDDNHEDDHEKVETWTLRMKILSVMV